MIRNLICVVIVMGWLVGCATSSAPRGNLIQDRGTVMVDHDEKAVTLAVLGVKEEGMQSDRSSVACVKGGPHVYHALREWARLDAIGQLALAERGIFRERVESEDESISVRTTVKVEVTMSTRTKEALGRGVVCVRAWAGTIE